MVGDPGGRSEERNLLDRDTLDHNIAGIKRAAGAPPRLRTGAVPGHVGRQRRLDGTAALARVPARRRQARDRQPDGGQGVRAQPDGGRARHLVHRVQLHAPAGQRLPLAVRAPRRGAADGRLGPVGQHHRGHRSHPADARAPAPTASPGRCSPCPAAPRWASRPAARSGSIRPRHARTSSGSSGCRPPTTRSAGTCAASACGRWARSTSCWPLTRRRPSAAGAQRALAEELTELVHGREAARAVEEAAGVLFGGDPLAASAEGFAVVRREVGATVVPRRRAGRPCGPAGPDPARQLQQRCPAHTRAAWVPGQRAGPRRPTRASPWASCPSSGAGSCCCAGARPATTWWNVPNQVDGRGCRR